VIKTAREGRGAASSAAGRPRDKRLVSGKNMGSLPAASISTLQPDPAVAYSSITLTDLFNIEARQHEIPWEPFRDGVEIHRLYGDGITGPTAALIRFRDGGKVPLHEHEGYEHILVLTGTQRDNNATAEAGTLIVSPPGTQHSIVSDGGCIVLAIYEKPVKFLQKPA
jgi:quercetin dioxygenase-like cupin family protein